MSKLYDILNSMITRLKKVETNGADWNASEGEAGHVNNRTHYEETTVVNEPLNITWDGDTEGLVSVEGTPLYKISDLVLTEEQLKACTATLYNGPSLVLSDIWDDVLADGALIITEDVIGGGFGVYVARKDGASFSPIPDPSVTFPESGIYFVKFSEESFVSSLTSPESFEQTKTVVHKLDPKFLPEGYPYAKEGLVEVMPEQTEFEYDDGRTGYYMQPVDLDPYKRYTIAVNGTKYPATVNFDTSWVFGFEFVVETSDIGTVIVTPEFYQADNDVEDVKTLAIYEDGEIVHKLDPKFLPNGQKMVYAFSDGQGSLYKDPECENPYMKNELFALGLNFVIRVTHGDPDSALFLRAPVQMNDDGDRARVSVCTTNGANLYYYSGEDVGPM